MSSSSGSSADLDARIDELYGLPLGEFTPARDALSKELRTAGDAGGAATVKALKKPVVSAWALNRLAREDPSAIGDLVELGGRLRDAQRRALSGGDAEPFRTATEERRALVGRLVASAEEILAREGLGTAGHADDLRGTLEAASADEAAGELVRSGRLTRPLRPPTAFGGGGGLKVLEGGRRAASSAQASPDSAELTALRRELRASEVRERRAAEAVERERGRVEELERKRSDARERLRAAEAEVRGASLESKRLTSRIAKLSAKPR